MKVGTKINGRYQVKELIGSGGMAKVYLAHDLILDRDVAVKMLRLDFRDDEATIKRFQREALAATELVHPNVVSIYDVGEENGLQYIVMEYVNGTDLKQYIKDNYPISFDQIVKMMEQILSAISLAHKHQIIHRDLKPQNILVDSEGNCKITDFGIALALTETSVTQTNTLLGSVHYLSPEQARGSIATKQSDIYALGIILYEMLTGDVPFDGESAVSIALQHFQDEIPSIKEYYPNVPQALENVVLKATAKNPEDRYQTADEMAKDLETVLNASRADEKLWKPTTSTIDDITEDDLVDLSEQDDKLEKNANHRSKNSGNKKKLALILIVLLLLVGGCTALFYSGGKNIDVPNVEGKTIAQATAILENRGLNVNKKYKYQYSDDVDKDLVISTSPSDNEAAKKGSDVTLFVSKGKKEAVIEDYTGMQYEDVVKKLKEKGIKNSQIKKEERLSSKYAEGQVMSQDPTSGVLSRGKGKIKLVVSSGVTGKMKDLEGMTLEEVQKYAEENELTVVEQYEYSNKAKEGEVLSQDPTKGTTIQVGDTIFVTFAKEQVKQPVYNVPNKVNQNKVNQNQGNQNIQKLPNNQVNNGNVQDQNAGNQVGNQGVNQTPQVGQNQGVAQNQGVQGNAGNQAGNTDVATETPQAGQGAQGNAGTQGNMGADAGAQNNNQPVTQGE